MSVEQDDSFSMNEDGVINRSIDLPLDVFSCIQNVEASFVLNVMNFNSLIPCLLLVLCKSSSNL